MGLEQRVGDQGLWGLMAMVRTAVGLSSRMIEISFGSLLRLHGKLPKYSIHYGKIKNSEEIQRWRNSAGIPLGISVWELLSHQPVKWGSGSPFRKEGISFGVRLREVETKAVLL